MTARRAPLWSLLLQLTVLLLVALVVLKAKQTNR